MQKFLWKPWLVLIVLLLGAMIFGMIAVTTGVMALMDLINDEGAPASIMITAVVSAAEALLTLVCAWYVAQKIRRLDQADAPLHIPFSRGYVLAVVALVLPALALGGAVAYQETPFLSLVILPVPTLIVIGLPLWLFLGIGARGLESGARWRFFSVLGLGVSFSPMAMILMEFLALGLMLLVGLGFAATQPGMLDELMKLAELAQLQTDQDELLRLLGPYLFQPGVLAAALVYIAMIVPLIEELFKPAAMWLFAKEITTPAQGFALGVVSGAAFSILESLNAGSDGSSTWALTVSVRATTSLLHIAASGLVGWGFAVWMCEKKFLRFVAAYLSAAAIHGLWNACALLAGLSSIGYLAGNPDWIFAIVPPALGGMAVLVCGMFLFLVFANRKLRA